MPLPTRDTKDVKPEEQDFIYKLLYTFTVPQVREAFEAMLKNMKEYVPQITDRTTSLAHRIGERDAMTLSMLFVLVMDDTNGFTLYAQKEARPPSRLDYFRMWFSDFSHNFMGTMIRDARVPDPRAMVAAARGEYIRRRDNGKMFKEHHHEETKTATRNTTTTRDASHCHLPRDENRSAER